MRAARVIMMLCVLLCAAQAVAKTKTTSPVAPASAQKDLGTFGAWHSYSYSEGGQQVCYMVDRIQPKNKLPKRNAPYLLITHRPTEGSIDVISYNAGMGLDSKRGAEAVIGKDQFDLFAVSDTAWARDAQTDHRIAKAIRNATSVQMTAFGTGKKPQMLRDVFVVTGAPAAYHAISKACDVPDDAPKKAPVKKTLKKNAVKKK